MADSKTLQDATRLNFHHKDAHINRR